MKPEDEKLVELITKVGFEHFTKLPAEERRMLAEAAVYIAECLLEANDTLDREERLSS